MTYIEFFDTQAVENIGSCLISAPERVILIGYNKKVLQRHAQRYHDFFLKRGENIEFLFQSVNRNSLSDIVELLSDIVEEYEDCVFDLSGGEDLMLVAVGIVYHRYRDRGIQMHRLNLRSNMLYDCDCDGVVIPIKHLPVLSTEEIVSLWGGKVIYEDERAATTRCWDWGDEFQEDIRAMWRICRKNVRDWNAQMDTFAFTDTVSPTRIVDELLKGGLITAMEQSDTLKVCYKNEQIRKCLTKAGQVLELYITLLAMQAEDKNGDPVYNDVCTGVFIDWDGGEPDSEEVKTENEIDVIMMHGLIPVFVSCKNGNVDMDELYKLNTVAERFGGRYAKKVLIANALGADSLFTYHLRQRAKDMKITLIENIQYLSEKEIQAKIEKLWCI